MKTIKELLEQFNKENGNIDKMYYDEYIIKFAEYVHNIRKEETKN